MQKVKHKKTGNIYYIISSTVIDCTNSRDGTKVILYRKQDCDMLFIRDADEFWKKFEVLQSDQK